MRYLFGLGVALVPGGGEAIGQGFDIRDDLSNDNSVGCDAMIRCILGVVCMLAIAVVGCSETSRGGGVGGAGIAGAGGESGKGGGYWPHVECSPSAERCQNWPSESYRTCCDPEVPEQANACDGMESLENPETCTLTGERVFYRLTQIEVEEDCNVGYNLDGCDGQVCMPGALAAAEGVDGVDNGLGGLSAFLSGVGSSLGALNQLFSDTLCGLTEDWDVGVCEGGDSDGEACADSRDCFYPEGTCNRGNGDCLEAIPPLEIYFVIDANAAEGCANLSVLAGGEANAQILNLNDEGCMSGVLGTVPIFPDQWLSGLAHAVVRMTVSPAGISHGVLGGMLPEESAIYLFEIVWPGSLDVGQGTSPFDISASNPWTPDGPALCDSMSATFRIGGIVEDPREGGL